MDECKDCEAFVEEKEDEILEMAVYYILKGRYESNLSKDKKRAVACKEKGQIIKCRGWGSFHEKEKTQSESQ